MKKIFYYAMCACAVLAFGACSDDDDKVPETGQDNTVITEFDEVEYLQNSLVRVDEDGEFLYRVCGEPLDDADSTKLYVGVEDMAAAQKLFKELFPAGTQFTQKDNGGLEVTLKKNAGTATLQPSQEEKGELAKATFNTTPTLKLVSSLHFIDSDSWEDNANPSLAVGDAVTMDGKKYVCIRSKKRDSQGRPSLFLHMTDKMTPYAANQLINVTSAEAEMVRKLLTDPNTAETIREFFKTKANVSYADDEEVWIDGYRDGYYRWEEFYYSFNLKSGQVTERNCFTNAPQYRTWLIRTINF